MKPVSRSPECWIHLDTIGSTQTEIVNRIARGEKPSLLLADDQTDGHGRLGRKWSSERGNSLTVSIALWDYLDHPKPHLLGMSLALAAAGAIKCQLRWPNDLILNSKKVGGLLTQVVLTPKGRRLPVIGIGINLNQSVFSADLDVIATSLKLETGRTFNRDEVLSNVLNELEILPEPGQWSDIARIWHIFDQTPGKLYRLPNGDFAQALGVGSDGQLICSIDGETSSVQVADALFGG